MLDIDQEVIKQIPLINSEAQDDIMWVYESNGIYSVKSGYRAIKLWQEQDNLNANSSSPVAPVWNKVWALHTIPRHKNLLWRILQNALPVRVELRNRGIPYSLLCPRCNEKVEDITHAFMTCPKIIRTWFGSNLAIKLADLSNPNFSAWLFEATGQHKERTLIQIAALIYNIWHARNLSVFEQKELPEIDIIQRANRSIHEFLKAQLSNASFAANTITPNTGSPADGRNNNLQTSRTSNANSNVKWKKPEAGLVKANCDVSLKVKGKWGVGSIVRNEQGLIMAAATWESNGSTNVLEAEAFGMLKTMRFSH